ncbi:MAG: hypothetical protein GF308_04705 [Candidatus Heimdallarchaeota archaeon]|nr:hypothetical protein [Candidatus Heimdallarchaeota archaeon]
MITAFNLFNALSYIISGVVEASISVVVFTKNSNKRLNQLFSGGFFLFAIGLIFNGLTFAVAHRSLFAANILRDVSTSLGIIGMVLFFLAAYGIYFGAASLNFPALLIFGLIAVSLAVVNGFNDWVQEDGAGGYMTTDSTLGKVFGQVVPLLFVVAAVVLLFLTRRKLESPLARKRISAYALGSSTMLIGSMIFVLDKYIPMNPIILPIIAQFTWVAGPAIMLASFYLKVKPQPTHPIKDGEQKETETEEIVEVKLVEPPPIETNQQTKLERPS